MTDRLTFRLPEELMEDIEKVYQFYTEQGLDLDTSKVIRYLLTKGIEKLKLEGKIK